MQEMFPYLLNGVSVGGQYALIAIGYTLVYGILRLINFAHGDIFTAAGFFMIYLTYFASDYEGLAAVIDVDNDKEIIFGDELTIDSIVWTGVQPTIKEKSERVGIEETRPFADFATYVKNAQAKGQEIHFLPPYRGEHQVWLQELLGINPAEQEAKASLKFIKAVVAQRNYKSEEEIAQIEEAVNVSVDMHCAAMRAVRPGTTEAEIVAVVQAEGV